MPSYCSSNLCLCAAPPQGGAWTSTDTFAGSPIRTGQTGAVGPRFVFQNPRTPTARFIPPQNNFVASPVPGVFRVSTPGTAGGDARATCPPGSLCRPATVTSTAATDKGARSVSGSKLRIPGRNPYAKGEAVASGPFSKALTNSNTYVNRYGKLISTAGSDAFSGWEHFKPILRDCQQFSLSLESQDAWWPCKDAKNISCCDTLGAGP